MDGNDFRKAVISATEYLAFFGKNTCTFSEPEKRKWLYLQSTLQRCRITKLKIRNGGVNLLKILIISENMKRALKVMNSICRRENDLIVKRDKHQPTIHTKNTVYIVVPPEPFKLAGFRADQVILDYVFINSLRRDVMAVLASSCVPQDYQIIDDRTLLT